jgi:RNA polymerase sigma-70 factor (ECF subfamily)
MGRVQRVTALLCSSRADADDAAQAALVEILNSARGFRAESSLESWADRITVRVTLRTLKREQRRQHLLARWLSPGALPWGRSAETSSTGSLAVEGFLARLSSERRKVLVLHHALDFSVEEIARITGAPQGTVKDRLIAARKQLRRVLEREARRVERGGRLDIG